jgi:carboxymethylenebutenolidase
MRERTIDIPTKDGATTTFIVHPERGGPYPVIFFYMDAPAIREELRDMARRFASVGYYVVLPNLYYHSHSSGNRSCSSDPRQRRSGWRACGVSPSSRRSRRCAPSPLPTP